MKEIDFNSYLRNKYNGDVRRFVKSGTVSERSNYMNIVHNKLLNKKNDDQVKNAPGEFKKETHNEQHKMTNSSCSSEKRTGDSKIIHLKEFK